ncbi:MAG TPA: rubrerythrin family protein [Mobilitalea sp.]|nr:rubrerythrin family protein [Mobilitalea sp.]
MEFKQSKTYQNLLTAYDWEAIVSTRYSIFADTARDEGYREIGNVFDTAVRNDKEHARIWLRQLNSGILPNTEDNLSYSAELTENGNAMYREFARVSQDEGFTAIAALFNGVANIELNHNLSFRTLYADVIRNEVFCKPQDELWICMQCGNIMSGPCAPKICPVCGFPQGYYRLYVNTPE